MSGATSVVASVSRSRPALILWRHVIQELIAPTLIGFLVFTFLMLMRWLLEISRLWIQYGADLSQVLWAVVYSLPHIVVLTLPMGVLVGGLIAFGRMSSDFEIVALRALGVSLLHLLPPVLIFSGVLWLANGYLFMVAMPWGNQSLREMQWETMTQRAFSQEFKPRVFHDGFPGVVIYIEDIVDQGREWHGVFLAQTDTDPPTILRAERAFPIIDEEARTTYLLLKNGTVINSAGQNVTIIRFDERQVLVWSEEENSLIGTVGKDGRSMTIPELQEAIAARQARGDAAWDLQVEIHKKFAIPFACLVMGLISLPLGISTQRQATATGFGIGTAVIMVYYFFAQYGEQFGDVGRLPPWLGMWAGNIVLGIGGAFLLWHKTRERDLGIVRRLRPGWEKIENSVRRFVRQRLFHRSGATALRRRQRTRFPRTLDRYVMLNYSSIYLLASVSMVLVITAGTWIEKASYVDNPSLIPRYLQFYVWEIIAYAIPIAAVVTVLATFSLMSKRAEVVAALAGGISIFRLVLPILLPAFALTALQYVLQDVVLPTTTRQRELIEAEMHPSSSGGATLQQRRTWVFSEGQRVFHFADYLADPPRFLGLRIYYLSDGAGGIARVEYANRAIWNSEMERWEGHDGWRRYYVSNAEDNALRPNPLEEYKFAVLPITERPEYFNQSPLQPDEMSTLELRRHVEQLRESGYDTHRALVDYHLKIAQPFVVLVMTLVGLPFAFRMGRQGALTGVGIAIGLALVYWIVFAVFRALGYAGQLPPPLAAWAPHLLFIALGGYLALGVRT